jgi:hypothetical protein
MDTTGIINELESDYKSVLEAAREVVDRFGPHHLTEQLKEAVGDMEMRLHDQIKQAEKLNHTDRWAKLYDFGDGRQVLFRKGFDEEDESFVITITVQYDDFDADMKWGFETEEARDSVFQKTGFDQAWKVFKMIDQNTNELLGQGL